MSMEAFNLHNYYAGNLTDIVYEQNLGPDGADAAEAISAYDPDDGWIPAKEVSGPQANAKQ